MPVKRSLERLTINFLMRFTKLSIKRPAANVNGVSTGRKFKTSLKFPFEKRKFTFKHGETRTELQSFRHVCSRSYFYCLF